MGSKKSRRSVRFERLEQREVLAVVGSAPEPYPVAAHSGDTGPILGASRTIDDGITFGSIVTGRLDNSVTIEVTGATSGTVLDAWIDFDLDGSFSEGREQIFDSVPVGNGEQVLRFDAPAWAHPDETYARFRISNVASGVGQGQTVGGGEVEDYLVTLLPPFAGEGRFGNENVITDGPPNGVVGLVTGDFNQDGLLDVVSTSQFDGEIALFRQQFDGTWERTLVGVVGTTNPLEDVTAIRLTAADLDGDGDLDLASASAEDNTIAWYRNDAGATSFQKFTIDSNAPGARSVVAADLDRDGRIDLASLSILDGRLRVHRNTGASGSAAFTSTIVYTFPVRSFPADLASADLDDDGWEDLVTVTAVSNNVDWFRNDETPFNGDWDDIESIYNGADSPDPPAGGVLERRGTVVLAGDLDGDDDQDVVVASFAEGRIDWFRNSNDGASWSGRRTVDSSFDGANALYLADVDGDEDLDVLGASFDDNEVAFLRNSGSGSFTTRDTVAVSTPTSVAAGDVNGDGVLDVVTGSWLDDRVSWWENPSESPEARVEGEDNQISDGDSSPRTGDGTDFGTVLLGEQPIEQVFVIENTGDGTLTVGEVTVPIGFTLVTPPTDIVPPDEETFFTVRLDSDVLGVKTGDVSFETNDSNENPYNFEITGSVNLGPEATLLGSGIEIVDNDSSPNTADGTDFGVALFDGATIVRTFTVRNDGDQTLSLSGLSAPEGYTITNGLSSSLSPGGSDTFTIRLDTADAGVKSGQVSFVTNDVDESLYSFSITGSVEFGPEAVVLGNDREIADGDSTPRSTDGTDFGVVTIDGPTVTRTFTLRNDGDQDLTLGSVTVPTGFTVIDGLVSTLAPGQTDTLSIRLDSTTPGEKTGDVVVTTNDEDQNPYNFAITGLVAAGPEARLLGSGLEIADGDTTPTAADGTDFGTLNSGGASETQSFTLRNDGDQALATSDLVVPNGFTITNGLASSIGPGSSDTFSIRLVPTSVGVFSGEVRFTTNDADESLYSFSIIGRVEAGPIAGDYTGDGVVDNADYDLWISQYGASGADLAADGNNDGVVNAADYTVWRDNLGSTASSAAATQQPTDPNNNSPTTSDPDAAALLISSSSQPPVSQASNSARHVEPALAEARRPSKGAAPLRDPTDPARLDARDEALAEVDELNKSRVDVDTAFAVSSEVTDEDWHGALAAELEEDGADEA